MRPTWTNSVSRGLAEIAARCWGAEIEGHVGDSGNAVWRVRIDGELCAMRLGDPVYRTLRECRGELAYVRHLHEAGVRVALPVPSLEGPLVEEVRIEEERMLASVFQWAPGEHVFSSSPLWSDTLFRAWGRILAQIHVASQGYVDPLEGDRWDWRDELFLRHADVLIPREDADSWRIHDEIYAGLDRLPVDPTVFGMTHGDFAPQNFCFDPSIGITVFDFGNACRHWFISDLVVGLTAIRKRPDRDHIRQEILAGYREIRPIDPTMLAATDLFFRLRYLYAWLSRLMKFGDNPSDEEWVILEKMRGMVHGEGNWAR